MSPPDAAVPSPHALDARASDPARLNWMVGSPPPPDKLIRWADGSFARFPRTRWSYSHMRELMPTRAVSRDGMVRPLERAERPDIDDVTFTPIGRRDTMTWAESLLANYTDGVAIVHRGRLVYERYFGALSPRLPHIAYSVTKSLVAILAASLVHEGRLDERAPLETYVPEIRETGFADATVRHLLDMTTGLEYSEDYTDESSSIWAMSRAGGFRPRPAAYDGPDTFYGFIRTIGKNGPHGERFAYKTVNTDMLAWVLARVTGRSLTALVEERLWTRLGVEHDAYFTIDSAGVEFAGAGLNLTLRDLARVGELMRNRGAVAGQALIPAPVIDDIRSGGDRHRFAGAGYQLLPGWSYRSMWWVSHNDHGAFAARGIHGQAIYVDPTAEMVIARFASHPLGANANLDPTSLPAYHAVARHLMTSAT
jgi:CubicO group peptidase (beta-lactamase class C family)